MNLSSNGFKIRNLIEDNYRISFFFSFFFFGDIYIFKSLLFYILYNLCFLLTLPNKNPGAAPEFMEKFITKFQ